MHHFPRMSDVIEGLRYQGYVGPSEDITEKIFLSILAVEHLTGISIFRRLVGENLKAREGWLYLSAYSISEFYITNNHLFIEEIDFDVCAVKIANLSVTFISRMLATADTQEIQVNYFTGYKDGELPSLYQELVLNLIYYNVLPSIYRNSDVESEINRLLEITKAQKLRFQTNRFQHMVQQGVA